ncbi:hypothetical protein COY52_12655 [Candidatus Desantisbacteria bacterium CG_4_10_14_0_8_um_filter_48_22]|uniref:Periplasmic chaperone PpiD n=1 Tax=Candidatus Desantisbacteria bacterium CG_4_10_14_0_8_um_filter_48_22 TaxID=1974543 RepID=A0A2M7S4E0_9BACT|nr:MAG: hypothetical protein COY52_12655 [Candidatus Desantisbacteria bacterium CG_4_10_14_0_8_um_filter_48_22]
MNLNKKIIYAAVPVVISLYLFCFHAGECLGQKKNAQGKSIVAKVNSSEIAEDFFNSVYDRFMQDFRNFNPGSPVDEETKNWARKYVIDEFIKREIVIQEAKKKNFKVSDAEVDKIIKDHPYFKGKDGKFDNTKYLWAINDPNFNLKQVREQVRGDDELIYTEFQKEMMNREKASDGEALEEFKKRTEKVKVQCALLKSAVVADTSLTEAEISSYFKANTEKYRMPARAKVKYVVITPEKVRSGTTVSNEEIAAYYNSNKDEFFLPERIKISHIMAAVPPDADTKTQDEKKAVIEKVLGLLKSGKKFEDLAGEYSEDRGTAKEGGSIGGYIPKGRMRDLDDILFAMKKGQYTKEPVKTAFGYHLFRLDDRRDAGIGLFDEVFDAVREAVLKKKSEERAALVAGQIAAEVKNITDLESSAAPYGGLTETPLFSEKDSLDTIGYIPEFNKRSFALKKGGIDRSAVPLEWRPKKILGHAVIALADRIESSIPTMEEVRNSLILDCKRDKEKELTRINADSVMSALRASDNFITTAENAGCETKETTITRYQYYIEGIGYVPDLAKASFDSTPQEAGLIKGGAVYSVEVPAGICIFKPVERTGVDEKAFAKEKDSLKKNIESQKNTAAFDKWYDEAKKRAKIEVYIKTE